ncbi:hypothetical protein CANINC_001120 [Pichia inconspicua]|uniref:Glycoside hydrolase family 5 domain-containing protein n=1 Tax=Pichia inconspicua TaxID=52247 RepID=A0A4V4NG15_9ASCO|nr:hypothetical protein CANINC_001120 [[Candida] inconspicua]
MQTAVRTVERMTKKQRGIHTAMDLNKTHHRSTSASPFKTKTIVIDNQGRFVERDSERVLHLHGINFSSSTKTPSYPLQSTHLRAEDCGFYDNADDISFTNKPFPANTAYEHLSRIKQCGFNTIRFVTTWEALEHKGPGIYDMEYIDYLTKLLKIVEEVGGLYVFIDPHQDVWARFCGGSGAPAWTLYAAGLEPRHFEKTLACKLHHYAEDPELYTKMVWATNYHRLASEVMFTMFFSGEIFLPKANINGVNIQTYLQSHFINAFAFLMNHFKKNIPEIFDTCLLGIESMNEPNSGLFGHEDLSTYSPTQELKLDESPTPIQSFRLGMGLPQQVDTYSLSVFGPTKNGSRWIDPEGVKAWIQPGEDKDEHYGFNRSSEWKLGECIFAQHGIWDISSGDLKKPFYFRAHPDTGRYFDSFKFNNTVFLDFWELFRNEMRKIDNNILLIMQPPVLQVPPMIEKKSKYVDNKTAIALHYYDGMSLMFQKWNRLFNVDTLGIMRGKYINPIFGLNFGEKNIRKSIRTQLKNMVEESNENCGEDIPVIFTETGMPFNMDNKEAYKSGKFDSQEAANDAIMTALENEQINFTYWCYNPSNTHEWGDYWNLEDFSIWSKDNSKDYSFQDSPTYSEWLKRNSPINNEVPRTGTSNEDDFLAESSSEHSSDSLSKTLLEESTHHFYGGNINAIDLSDGVRAVNAIIRPSPQLVNGIVRYCQFDHKTKGFELKVLSRKSKGECFPDIITLPLYHYHNGNYKITVSHGSFKVYGNRILQWIEWDHSNENGVIVELNVKVLEDNKGVHQKDCGGILKGLACGCF